MTKQFTLRLSDQPSRMETTHERLALVAQHLGVSLNRAASFAINQLYEKVEAEQRADDARLERAFHEHGVKIGGATYLGLDAAAIERARSREKAGVPFAAIDDDQLERHLVFAMLSPDRQARVRAASPDAKREALASAVREQAQGDEQGAAS